MAVPQRGHTRRATSQAKTWPQLILRAGSLGISADDIAGCRDFREMQRLVRKRYLALSQRYHPDHEHQSVAGYKKRHHEQGYKFNKCTRAYKWFESLTEADYDRAIRVRQTVPDPVLPLDWNRWASVSRRYHGFQIVMIN